eukprot:CAMPEP_0115072392 /NCGR_PEP_ID=MMETSP0227-20121206/14203_1 /TAXON_ID=89957 /ORGANISM="Polarella glacialis, Strain CCMP 1383" /LENGTH=144 /DNA_ID=CAMNT_0002459131 /DNA_START=151 /DNA_END=582 /DNA_ORIENTATION=+
MKGAAPAQASTARASQPCAEFAESFHDVFLHRRHELLHGKVLEARNPLTGTDERNHKHHHEGRCYIQPDDSRRRRQPDEFSHCDECDRGESRYVQRKRSPNKSNSQGPCEELRREPKREQRAPDPPKKRRHLPESDHRQRSQNG